mmetsp:Transcript_97150/g.190802  ORF Transcript_97150/g.190802 Transcript_97150/m.190802 type:complete len:169 (-) Transcript_97150:112-618(-)
MAQANWQPLNAPTFFALVEQLRLLNPQESVFNPPANGWAASRRHTLREALQLGPSERNDQITNLVIAIANACIDDHLGEYTADVLVARGWIVPIGDVWQRITDLEGVVAANHTQVTEQLAQQAQVMAHMTEQQAHMTEQLAQVLAALGNIQNQNQNAQGQGQVQGQNA